MPAFSGQPAEAARGNPFNLFEKLTIIAGAVKAAGIGDFRNRLPGIGKKGETLFNPIGQKVGYGGHRKMFPEQAAAGAFADMEGRGEFF